MRRPLELAAIIAVILGGAAGAAAQPPPIDNAQVTSQPAGRPFAESVRALASKQADVTWIGYSVPAVPGDRTMCCFDSNQGCCGSCRLDPSSSGAMMSRPPAAGTVKLEGSDRLLVLLRVSERRVERVRVFSEGCGLDAGGRSVIWLESVVPAESVAHLESLAGGADTDPRGRLTEGAVAAIALHADGAADAALERLLAADRPTRVREAVPFWLGNARGSRGLEILRRVVKEDASTEVRKKAVFGISQSREAAADDTLIDAARHNDRSAVRGEAIFWLGQKAGRKAADAITERIEQDPETDVKKRAVFALSQLPKDEGVPLLIRVARTHTNPAVRKQAMFWLGQSRDPRAIDFFAEILQ